MTALNFNRLQEAVLPVFEKHRDRGVFSYLFGSASKEDMQPLSDVDIAVYFSHGTSDFFTDPDLREGLIRAAWIFPFITSIRLDHLVTSSIFDRSEFNLSLPAFSLLRHSFFIECAWAKCNQLIFDHFAPIKQDMHHALLSHVFNFVLSGRYNRF
jgi:predicted nucleotidyltransferase